MVREYAKMKVVPARDRSNDDQEKEHCRRSMGEQIAHD
jgi:hypothetical protein